ncbi:hypothetical protein OROGR_030442 [Orobanche gracilis]
MAHLALYEGSSLLLQIIIAILFLLNPSSGGNVQSSVTKICAQFPVFSDDRSFCQTFYKQNPSSNINGLIKVTVLKTLGGASHTNVHIGKKIRSSGNDPNLQGLYNDCQVAYTNLVNKFTNAQGFIARGNYASMKSAIRDSDRPVTDCQKAIDSRDGDLAKQNKQNLALVKMSIASGNQKQNTRNK